MRTIKGLMIMLMIGLTALGLFSCGKNRVEGKSQYEQITSEQAKKIMDTEPDCMILDVRTQSEFEEGHIENAILIPYDEMEAKAGQNLPDKDQLILVYCRSGRRSKLAAETLVEMGYTNVKEFGGIIDWSYEIVE